jgi:hypothetical protein
MSANAKWSDNAGKSVSAGMNTKTMGTDMMIMGADTMIMETDTMITTGMTTIDSAGALKRAALGLAAAGYLLVAPFMAHADDTRPTDSAVSVHAKAFGVAVKRDTKAVGAACKEGAHRVAAASTAVAHEIAGAAKRSSVQIRAAFRGEKT